MKTSEEFWNRVANTHNADLCWDWLNSVNNSGYGTLEWCGRAAVAHRVAAYLTGMVEQVAAPKKHSDTGHVLHKCDTRACCNPGHFFIGTYSDNQKDCYAKGRANKAVGAAHTNAKLTQEQAMAIWREYHAGGISQQSLANRYGVSQVCVSLVCRGITYK